MGLSGEATFVPPAGQAIARTRQEKAINASVPVYQQSSNGVFANGICTSEQKASISLRPSTRVFD